MKQVIAIVNKGNKVPLFTLSDKLAGIVRHELQQNAEQSRSKYVREIIYITKKV